MFWNISVNEWIQSSKGRYAYLFCTVTVFFFLCFSALNERCVYVGICVYYIYMLNYMVLQCTTHIYTSNMKTTKASPKILNDLNVKACRVGRQNNSRFGSPKHKTQGPCGSLAPEHLSKHQGFWFLSPSAKWFYLKYPNGLRGWVAMGCSQLTAKQVWTHDGDVT
jgi:hypothetical protein